jgi:hypothetical protein
MEYETKIYIYPFSFEKKIASKIMIPYNFKYVDVSKKHVVSIQDNYMLDKIMKNTRNAKEKLDELSQKYDEGKTIIELSRIVDYPPLTLLQMILKHKYGDKCSKSFFKIVVESKYENLDCMNKHDLKQMQLARNLDDYTRIDPNEAKIHADMFEDAVGRFLSKINVTYKT